MSATVKSPLTNRKQTVGSGNNRNFMLIHNLDQRYLSDNQGLKLRVPTVSNFMILHSILIV